VSGNLNSSALIGIPASIRSAASCEGGGFRSARVSFRSAPVATRLPIFVDFANAVPYYSAEGRFAVLLAIQAKDNRRKHKHRDCLKLCFASQLQLLGKGESSPCARRRQSFEGGVL
jgi:hypothetical protein